MIAVLDQYRRTSRQITFHRQDLSTPILAQERQPHQDPVLFRYQFREPLIAGVILKKRKRFTADVEVDGQVVVCHCPTTCLSLYQTLLDGQQVRAVPADPDGCCKAIGFSEYYTALVTPPTAHLCQQRYCTVKLKRFSAQKHTAQHSSFDAEAVSANTLGTCAGAVPGVKGRLISETRKGA